ncbi:MAG TPA: hypothetical protein DCM64_06415, partial [Gammaproteobacteria bacterium]|nr:hypothetical protein [Gammaproteobacteria bacterium]
MDLQCLFCGEKNQLVLYCTIPQQDYTKSCRIYCRPTQILTVIDDTVYVVKAYGVSRQMIW